MRGGIVERKVSKAAVAAIAVNEEEQIAVIIVVDDIAGEFEPSIGKIIKVAPRMNKLPKDLLKKLGHAAESDSAAKPKDSPEKKDNPEKPAN